MAPINKGIGVPVRRVEDERFLRGQGRYADDLYPRDTAFAYVVRSPHAHAVIRGIDTTRARSAPAVLSVLTGEDVIYEDGVPINRWTGQKIRDPRTQPSHPGFAKET